MWLEKIQEQIQVQTGIVPKFLLVGISSDETLMTHFRGTSMHPWYMTLYNDCKEVFYSQHGKTLIGYLEKLPSNFFSISLFFISTHLLFFFVCVINPIFSYAKTYYQTASSTIENISMATSSTNFAF